MNNNLFHTYTKILPETCGEKTNVPGVNALGCLSLVEVEHRLAGKVSVTISASSDSVYLLAPRTLLSSTLSTYNINNSNGKECNEGREANSLYTNSNNITSNKGENSKHNTRMNNSNDNNINNDCHYKTNEVSVVSRKIWNLSEPVPVTCVHGTVLQTTRTSATRSSLSLPRIQCLVAFPLFEWHKPEKRRTEIKLSNDDNNENFNELKSDEKSALYVEDCICVVIACYDNQNKPFIAWLVFSLERVLNENEENDRRALVCFRKLALPHAFSMSRPVRLFYHRQMCALPFSSNTNVTRHVVLCSINNLTTSRKVDKHVKSLTVTIARTDPDKTLAAPSQTINISSSNSKNINSDVNNDNNNDKNNTEDSTQYFNGNMLFMVCETQKDVFVAHMKTLMEVNSGTNIPRQFSATTVTMRETCNTNNEINLDNVCKKDEQYSELNNIANNDQCDKINYNKNRMNEEDDNSAYNFDNDKYCNEITHNNITNVQFSVTPPSATMLPLPFACSSTVETMFKTFWVTEEMSQKDKQPEHTHNVIAKWVWSLRLLNDVVCSLTVCDDLHWLLSHNCSVPQNLELLHSLRNVKFARASDISFFPQNEDVYESNSSSENNNNNINSGFVCESEKRINDADHHSPENSLSVCTSFAAVGTINGKLYLLTNDNVRPALIKRLAGPVVDMTFVYTNVNITYDNTIGTVLYNEIWASHRDRQNKRCTQCELCVTSNSTDKCTANDAGLHCESNECKNRYHTQRGMKCNGKLCLIMLDSVGQVVVVRGLNRKSKLELSRLHFQRVADVRQFVSLQPLASISAQCNYKNSIGALHKSVSKADNNKNHSTVAFHNGTHIRLASFMRRMESIGSIQEIANVRDINSLRSLLHQHHIIRAAESSTFIQDNAHKCNKLHNTTSLNNDNENTTTTTTTTTTIASCSSNNNNYAATNDHCIEQNNADAVAHSTSNSDYIKKIMTCDVRTNSLEEIENTDKCETVADCQRKCKADEDMNMENSSQHHNHEHQHEHQYQYEHECQGQHEHNNVFYDNANEKTNEHTNKLTGHILSRGLLSLTPPRYHIKECKRINCNTLQVLYAVSVNVSTLGHVIAAVKHDDKNDQFTLADFIVTPTPVYGMCYMDCNPRNCMYNKIPTLILAGVDGVLATYHAPHVIRTRASLLMHLLRARLEDLHITSNERVQLPSTDNEDLREVNQYHLCEEHTDEVYCNDKHNNPVEP